MYVVDSSGRLIANLKGSENIEALYRNSYIVRDSSVTLTWKYDFMTYIHNKRIVSAEILVVYFILHDRRNFFAAFFLDWIELRNQTQFQWSDWVLCS